MILEGTVQTIEGNILWVQAPNPVSCHSGEGCTSANCCSSKPVIFRARKMEDQVVHNGDYVRLAPPRGNPLIALIVFLGFPLLVAGSAYFVSSVYLPSFALPLAFAGGLVSLILPAFFRDNTRSLPAVIQVLPQYSLHKKTPG